MKKHKRITNQKLKVELDILRMKIDNIMSHLLYLETQLPSKPKKYLTFAECIPSVHICKEVNSTIIGVNTYEGFIGKLAEYYGCKPMGMLIDPNIDPKYIAVYKPLMGNAYSRNTTISRESVLHEWFHHMIASKIVIIDKEQEESLAKTYSRIFMERINSNV